jgi:lipopolysaccharide/colanic/teichoic acid biosynthesis glycosyltransferase
MDISKRNHNDTYLVIAEILFLLFFICIVSCIFYPINDLKTINLCFILWGLFVIFGFLFGEFEPTVSICFGLKIWTVAIFLSTIITYIIVFFLFNQLPEFNLVFWLIILFYLYFLAPIVGFIFRRIFPVPVVLVTDTSGKENLLKWWGYNASVRISKAEFDNWLNLHSDGSGKVANYDLILIDITNPASETIITHLLDKYFINFLGIKSYRLFDYITGFHTRVLTKYPGHGTQYRIKRLIDFFVCLAALILSAPLFLFAVLCIKLDSPGSVFFRHRRLGKNMRPFNLLKLRTMYQDADKRLKDILISDKKLKDEFERSFKLKKDPRITRTGKIIRQLSIDELPQIFNVLNGDMTLVGPRPIVEKEIDYYRGYSLDIFRVLPGVTGLWQTSGRTETTYEKRVMLDTRYVRNWSLLNDVKLLLKTIPAVISQKGAY